MKNWIKEKMEMTPKRRIDIGYWLATFQAITMMSLFQSLAVDEPMAIHWSLYLVVWFVIGFLYVKNTLAFNKETLWMTIKNPAKVTREEDGMMNKHPNRPPPPPPGGSRPKAPPRPPPRRFK
jgi:hypothetical protein